MPIKPTGPIPMFRSRLFMLELIFFNYSTPFVKDIYGPIVFIRASSKIFVEIFVVCVITNKVEEISNL
jgi:hypothetical protein